MKPLTEIRDEIDYVDKEIIRLFEERMALCKEVAEYKMAVGKAVFDREREAQKIERSKELTKNDSNREYVGELFHQLMGLSRKMQTKMIEEAKLNVKNFEKVQIERMKDVCVVFQGIKGAYGYQAMYQYFGSDMKNFSVETFRDAMEAVSSGKADYAVLPMENSSAGIVGDVYDLLMEYDNYIVDICDLPVRHSLLGTKDSTIEGIKQVNSHPQALAQCSHFLEEHSGWLKERMLNTAISAKHVAEQGDATVAAIASKMNAELYGLKVLKENIQNAGTNTTRFAIIMKTPNYKPDANHVCVSFEVKHESGSLYKALSNLIYNDVNMTKIESRPIPERPFEYRFIVEVEGNLEASNIKNAFVGLKDELVSFKILGTY